MPNTFDPDGKPDLMSPQDQLAYMRATGATINARPMPPLRAPAETDPGAVDPEAARQYQSRISAEDAERRSAPKMRRTNYGMPMLGKP